MPRRTLAELSRIAASLIAKADLNSEVPEQVLVRRILAETPSG
jgi:hypothetical protein